MKTSQIRGRKWTFRYRKQNGSQKDKFRELYTETYYNQIVKSQKQIKYFEKRKKKANFPIPVYPHITISGYLSRKIAE